MIVDADRFSFFHELETSLHRRSVRNSPLAVAALLDDDFVEFGKSGRVYDKRRTIELLRDDDSDFMPEVRDFQIQLLSPHRMWLSVLWIEPNQAPRSRRRSSSLSVSATP